MVVTFGHYGHRDPDPRVGGGQATGQDYFDLDQSPDFDSAEPDPAPDFEFDQSHDR